MLSDHTHAASEVFDRRPDTDWEMFCRGRRDERPSWVDAASSAEAARGGDSGADWPTEADENAAVPLAPENDGHAGGVPSPAVGRADGAFVRHFHAKVVGVSYPNPDGSSRIEAVRGLNVRELVRLDHRPDNPVDPNAVAVVRPADGRQLGYLRAALAKDVVAAARAGTRYLALVHKVTGTDPIAAGEPVGAVLLVLALEGAASKAMARRYLLDLMNGRPA